MIACDPTRSQWFTPPWVAARMAEWIANPHRMRVLEPSCGTGNLIAAALDVGVLPENIVALDLDERMTRHVRNRFGGRVLVHEADYLKTEIDEPFDLVLSNFPYEQNLHGRMAAHSLRSIPELITLVPVNFEFGVERHRSLFEPLGTITNRARLPARPRFGGAMSGSQDIVALRMVRRYTPRRPGERVHVVEEVWTQDERGAA